MHPNKFKRLYKLEKVENTYEDDCQIFYPTEWDENYLAYKYYRQQCVHQIFGTPNSYVPMAPLYNVDNAIHTYDNEIEDFEMYHNHLEFIQAFDNNQLEIIETFDNEFEDIQTYYNEHFEDVDQEDFQSIDSDYEFIDNNSDTTQSGPSAAIDEDDFKFEENDLPREFRSYPPPRLTLGRFFCDKSASSRINVVKRRKAKQIRTIKVKCVNKGSSHNLDSIVHSTVQIEEITSTKTSSCHLAEVRIISRSSNEKVHLNRIEIDNICMKEVKTQKTFSQAVSWGSSKFISSNPTIINEQVDRILIDNPWIQTPTEDLKRSKTFSEIVTCGSPKIISRIETVSSVAENLKVDHPSVHISMEKCIPPNTIQGLTTTWSKTVKGEKHTTLVRSKSVKNKIDSNAETKSPKPSKVKFNKQKKSNFKKLDKLDTLLEIIVEPEQNEQPVVIKRQQPEFICYRTVPQQSKIIIPAEAESKFGSYKHAVVGVEKQSIMPATSQPEQKNDSTKIEINDHLENTIKYTPECEAKHEETWNVMESRRKSSKKIKNK